MEPNVTSESASPSDHTTLTEVLEQFADAGFTGQFQVPADTPTVRCLACDVETGASGIPQHTIRRLEGASDPDDMSVVIALTCPHCGARGTLVTPFGPNASAGEAAVLTALRDVRSDDVAPQNSAPGETIGDHTAGGHDALPGEPAPAFAASSSTGKTLALDDFIGKVPVVLTFTGSMTTTSAEELIASFEGSFPEFGRRRIQCLLVVPESEESVRRRRQAGVNVPLLADEEGRLLESYVASASFPASVLIDEHGTVTRLIEGGMADEHADHVLTVIDGISR